MLVLALSAAEVVRTALTLILEEEGVVAVMLERVAVVDESCWLWVMSLAVLGGVQRLNARASCVEKPR